MNPNHEFPTVADPLIRQRQRQRCVGAMLGILTFVFFVGAILAWIFLQPDPVDVRGCSGRPQKAVEILIDQTDSFSDAMRTYVTQQVSQLTDTLVPGELLTLMKLDPSNDLNPVIEVFSGCRPPRGQDVNWLADNPDHREKAYILEFVEPFQAARESFLQPGTANSTPLIKALHSVAQRPTFEGGGSGRTLMIFGDLLEHSELASFFKRDYSFEKIRKQNPTYLSGLQERYAGACVVMLVNTSTYPTQTSWPELDQTWKNYWKAAGVDCLTIKRL